jgi:hypothetical protein
LRKNEPVAQKRKPQKFQEDKVQEWLYPNEEESLGSTIKYGLKSNKEYPQVVECPALFVPVEMRQTGTEGAFGWHVERSILRSRL